MESSTAFGIVNNIALVGWLFLLIAPKWKYTLPVVVTAIIFLLAVTYSYLIIRSLPGIKPDGFSSLASIRSLFQNDTALLAGWIHYLAFDLFVGTYIVRQAQLLHIPRWVVTIVLPFVFLFGPLGYAIFQIIVFIQSSRKK